MGGFPESMTAENWEALLRLAEERVGRAWAKKNGYIKLDGVDAEALREMGGNWICAPALFHLRDAYLGALEEQSHD